MPNPYPVLTPDWVVVDSPFGRLEMLIHGPRSVKVGPFEEEVDESAYLSSSTMQSLGEKQTFIINGHDYNSGLNSIGFVAFRTKNGAIGVEFNQMDRLSPAAKRALIKWVGEVFDQVVTPIETAKARYRTACSRAYTRWEEAEKAKAFAIAAAADLKLAEKEYLAAGAALDQLEHEGAER